MQANYEEVSLKSLGSGAAVELFDEELQKVLENIADPNTKAKAVREITLKVKIKPSEDRSVGSVEIHTSSKLAPVKPYETLIFMGSDGSRVRAYESNTDQPTLPGIDEKIIKIRRR